MYQRGWLHRLRPLIHGLGVRLPNTAPNTGQPLLALFISLNEETTRN